MSHPREMSNFSVWSEVSTIGDLLVRSAYLHPDRKAVVFPEDQRSYAELLWGATQVAQGLLALGVRSGDKVGLMAANCSEFVEAFFGVALLGGVVVPLNARHKAQEIGYIVDNGELAAICTTADDDEYVDFSNLFCSALPSLADSDALHLRIDEAPRLRSAILLRGEGRRGFLGRSDFDKLANTRSAEEVDHIRRCVRIRDAAAIIYTSGTTANPKGCVLSHEAMTRGGVERARHRFGTGNHDVVWSAGPLFHIGSLAPFIGTMGAAGTYLTDSYFEPARALELMNREKATVAFPWFPAIVLGLIDHPNFDPSKLSSLASIILIAPPAQVERVQSLFPNTEIIQGCGMTETAGIFAISTRDEIEEQRATTQGKAVPGIEVRIKSLDSDGDAAPDEVGEILVRGYCVMDEYYRAPKKTAESLDEDGWLHTGDLYTKSKDGNLCFNGRLKDMLKVGGENVAAIEVEAFLCEHPAVRIAEVVGKADPRLDEVPVAFVELRADAQLSAEELIAFCKGRIASYKIPREVYFMQPEEWPTSATKMNKRALRAWLIAPADEPSAIRNDQSETEVSHGTQH